MIAVSGDSRSSSGAGESDLTAPSWLQDLVDVVGKGYAVGPIESGQFTLTSNATLHENVPDLGTADAALASKQFYVVALKGKFAGGRYPAGQEPPSGPVLVMTIDAESRSVSVIGIVHAMPRIDALGNIGSLSVTTSQQ
jgi:hypothetical protein